MIDFSKFRGMAIAVPLAAAGGAVATWIGMPASWFVGAMVPVAVAAVAGWNVSLPPRVINAALIMIGMMLGASVTPDVVSGLSQWPASLLALCLSVVAVQSGVQAFLRRIAGWDRETAFFAALPGAMIYALFAAGQTSADVRKVAIGQLGRVFLLIALLPSLISIIEPLGPTPTPVVAGPAELALILVTGIAGGLLFHWLHVPAGMMVGSLTASAILHGTGIVTGTFPLPVMIIAFIVLGASVGGRFVGTTLGYIIDNIVPTVGAFAVAITISSAFAVALTFIVDLPIDQLIIAFAPGGVDAMMAVALAMHMDTVFVAAHQLLRLMGVALLSPIAARFVLGRKPRKKT